MSRSAWLRVGDMVDAARMAIAWTQGLDREGFLNDDLRKSGVQWQLLVLGEAAKAVPADIQALEPSFNWRGRYVSVTFLPMVMPTSMPKRSGKSLRRNCPATYRS